MTAALCPQYLTVRLLANSGLAGSAFRVVFESPASRLDHDHLGRLLSCDASAGLVLAPMSCAPPMAQGLQFIPSMAAGVCKLCCRKLVSFRTHVSCLLAY